MSLTNLNELPIQNISLNTNYTLLILGFLQILLYRKRISSFLLGFQSRDALIKSTPADPLDQSVCRGEMEMVLKSLGMFCGVDSQVPPRMDADEIFGIFEEQRPSLDELREAFEVFDRNGDGRIDEEELHKVMSALGFKEGLEMDNCTRMIAVFDEDGDGRIDFHEFVNFMENTFT